MPCILIPGNQDVIEVKKMVKPLNRLKSEEKKQAMAEPKNTLPSEYRTAAYLKQCEQ